MAKSDNLRKAKGIKNDEFYTRLEDIETEISQHKDYVKQFEGKVVLCNCNDPERSNFFQFFKLHFKQLKLKKLITTHYNKDGSPSYKLEWYGEMLDDNIVNLVRIPLKGNGDFRSDECVEILKEADIVVANPPFSLFKEYVAQLVEYDKKFLIIGNQNAITYKEIFSLLKDNKIWLGYHYGDMAFKVPVDSEKKETRFWIDETGQKWRSLGNICWFTNFDIDKRREEIILTKNFNGNESKYPRYDNYDAINVNKVSDIPKDYFKEMAVPITFFGKYNPEQFDIINGMNRYMIIGEKKLNEKIRKEHSHLCNIDGNATYFRILIKRRGSESDFGGVCDGEIR